MTAETSDLLASIAAKYLHFGQADLVAIGEDAGAQAILVTDIRALAGSALRQHEEGELGLRVNLIDVFAAWGEREASDQAMLIDLCLGAAIQQLGGTSVRITGADLEELAGSGRIIRLQPEPNAWAVCLVPTEDSPVDYARAVEWSRGFENGEEADFLPAIYAVNGRAPTYRELAERGWPGLFEWIMEAFQNPPTKNPPEKQEGDQPLPEGKRDSQDGFGDNGS